MLRNAISKFHSDLIACCFPSSRSVFPSVIPREQLVSGNTRRLLPGPLPVCPAAFLALCLSRHQGSGGSPIPPAVVPPIFPLKKNYNKNKKEEVTFHTFNLRFVSLQGDRKCLTFYLPKLIIVGLLWLSAVTLGIWQT